MKIKKKTLTIISLTVAILMLSVVTIRLIYSSYGNVHLETTPAIDVGSGWKNIDTGELEERTVVTVLPGASLRLSRTLPEGLNDDNVLGYYDYGFRVVAYVEQEEVYTVGGDSYGKFGTQLNQAWRSVPLRAQDSGKNFTIILENDTDASLQVNLDKMQITYESSEVVRAIFSSGWALGIALACVMMTILLCILSVVVYKSGFKEHFIRLLLLATLSLDVGIWSWANSSLSQLIFTSESLGYKISYLAYVFIPFFLGMYYEKLNTGEPRNVFAALNSTYRFILVAIYILFVTGIVPLAQSVFITHTYLFMYLLYGSYLAIRDYVRQRTHANHWVFVGQAIFLMVSLIYIPLYYLRGEQHVYIYAGLAFLAFLLCMTMSQGYYVFRDLTTKRKEMEYRERSKTSPTTDGNSWIGFSYHMAEMDYTGMEAPWVVVMELTNISAINALFGWKSENKIVRGIYKSNMNVLTEEDYQATIGEALFGFLLPAGKDIEGFCRQIADGVQKYMEKEWQNAYLSPRFCACRVNPGDDLSKLIACAGLAYTGRDTTKVRDTFVYYYDADCYDRTIKAQVVEDEVNRALLREKMYLLMTPVYDVETGTICQADTTLVWNVKAEGDMFEYEAIPETEKHALASQMCNEHFALASKFVALHPDLGDVRVSVRVFPDCFRDSIFWNHFKELVTQYGLADLSQFDFELPLELGTTSMDIMKEAIRGLHHQGATVSYTRFDGSLSSIRLMRELGIDWVKFDRSMLIEANGSYTELYMQIEHLVILLHEQGQKVCVCGVTEQAEVEILKLIGVDRMRGQGLHAPVLVDTFMKLLSDDKEGQTL